MVSAWKCQSPESLGDVKDYEKLLLRNDCLRLAQDVALFGAGHEFTKLCALMGEWMETDGNGWFAHHVFFLCFNNFSSMWASAR